MEYSCFLSIASKSDLSAHAPFSNFPDPPLVASNTPAPQRWLCCVSEATISELVLSGLK